MYIRSDSDSRLVLLQPRSLSTQHALTHPRTVVGEKLVVIVVVVVIGPAPWPTIALAVRTGDRHSRHQSSATPLASSHTYIQPGYARPTQCRASQGCTALTGGEEQGSKQHEKAVRKTVIAVSFQQHTAALLSA
ncbi:hypothetical protein K437DRAFT_104573 [Tilletiaria anomala UBC 951]|uniref:Uncharacterized protein n=1 Tax=Tilletiaria anomala (strain ATCC 24038 / CBS 436.72 / UBC 951) TaxID=1037660 RepID=A0A066VYJ3_TILAU|nr:uncharacterized protein K437DRAFT_104573 [Tilletiaria anomala UBC 951]KDN46802.1 hypothetical protein K437DRAFT_104573 [Tilletiaria anomala UBC 951]